MINYLNQTLQTTVQHNISTLSEASATGLLAPCQNMDQLPLALTVTQQTSILNKNKNAKTNETWKYIAGQEAP